MKRLNLIIISIMMILTLTYQTSLTQTEKPIADTTSNIDSIERKVNYLKPKLESFNLVDSVKYYKLLIDTLKCETKENLIALKKQQAKLADVIDTATYIQIISLH